MSCYRFENIQYNEGLFNIVDRTYVIHLEGNGRIDNIRNELDKYKPSNQCTIVFNKGFKKCNKPELPKQLPPYDLTHAYMTILEDAKKNNYKHILILEDDFFFDKSVKECSDDISKFLQQNTDKAMTYFLGCIPWIVYPSLTNHYKAIFRIGTHAVIYNETAINKLLNENTATIVDWDFLLNKLNASYMYYKPLCYQYITETENSKHWGESNIVSKAVCVIAVKIYFLLKLDTNITPGYPFFYLFSKIFFWLLLFVLVLLIFYVAKKAKLNQKQFSKLFNNK